MLCFYVLPYNGIGGVESAARTLQYHPDHLHIPIVFIASKSSASFPLNTLLKGPFFSESNPLNYVYLLFFLFKTKPNVLIVSLWRSAMLGVLVKILMPQTHLITFLHLPTSLHFLDYIANRISCQLSSQIWADSNATLSTRIPSSLWSKSQTVTHFATSLASICNSRLSPKFIFWGRIAPQKNLPYAILIFELILAAFPSATFTIIAPDSSCKSSLIKAYPSLLSSASFKVFPGLSLEQISNIARDASFFLNTSIDEGMCMSVVEAMQLGLVPVVTPVGEIANYTQHKYNALHVTDPYQTLKDLSHLFVSPSAFYEMRQKSINTWRDHALYRDQFMNRLFVFLSSIQS